MTFKQFILSFLFIFISPQVFGQQGVVADYIRMQPTTLPTVCRTGDIRFNTSGSTLAVCSSSNTWTNFSISSSTPMTTLGDIIYQDATPAPARLAGNTTTTKKFLTQTGTGTISAVPAWGVLVGADLPNPSSSTLGGIQSIAAVSSNWIRSISTSGVPAQSQPAFTDISGSVASTQMPALTGDVTTSAGAVATTIAANAVTNAKMATMAANTVKANITGGAAVPTDVGFVSTNTASTGVFRDSSGNFSAGTITAALTGNASTATTATTATTVTTNANLTGPITSVGNATSVAAQTGTGSTFVMQASPTLTTPVIGAATGTSLSVSGSLTSTVATGTAPLVVSSTTQVANLNAATAGTATNSTNATTTATNSTNATFFPTFVASSSSGNQGVDTATGLTFNPSTNTLTTTTFSGALSGNATTATTATTGTNATNTAITNDTTTNATMYPTWVTANTGNLPQKTTDSKLTWNPSTGSLGVTTLVGAVTGTASGNLQGTASNHGMIISGSGNTVTVLAPDASTTKVWTSGGSSADPSWQTVAVASNVTASKTSAYTAVAYDFVRCDASGGTFAVTFPAAASNTGKYIELIKTDSSMNAVTFTSGPSTGRLSTPNEYRKYMSDGTNWILQSWNYDTDTTSYTPTVAGSGTISAVSAWWHREGEWATIWGKFTTGTCTGSIVSVSLPTGIVLNTSFIESNTGGTIIGEIFQYTSTANPSFPGTSRGMWPMVGDTSASTSVVYASKSTSSGSIVHDVGTTLFNDSAVTSFKFRIPVSNWVR